MTNGGGPARAVLLAGLLACAGSGPQARTEEVPVQETRDLRVTGTVRKAEVGSNCWRFVGRDGTSYELRAEQAPAGVLADGKVLTLELAPRADLMSTCMVGQIVDVVRVVTP